MFYQLHPLHPPSFTSSVLYLLSPSPPPSFIPSVLISSALYLLHLLRPLPTPPLTYSTLYPFLHVLPTASFTSSVIYLLRPLPPQPFTSSVLYPLRPYFLRPLSPPPPPPSTYSTTDILHTLPFPPCFTNCILRTPPPSITQTQFSISNSVLCVSLQGGRDCIFYLDSGYISYIAR